MLRSIELVNSWSRDGNHKFTTCEWNALTQHKPRLPQIVNFFIMTSCWMHQWKSHL